MSASYQASVDGFRRRGLSEEEAAQLVVKSVELAIEARDAFWANPKNRTNRLRPLVAASVGPYGAYLADGSEYGGRYGVSDEKLREFHRERFHLLAGSGADLLACETIPSAGEGYVLAELLRQTLGMVAWFSFSCGDGRHLNDGTPIAEVAARLEGQNQIVALGVNCTAPEHIPSLIEEIAGETTKPIVVYPNSGERYDAATNAVVSQSALVDALTQRRIAGAALDVFDTHPVAADSPLLRPDNVVLTPHLGGATEETIGRHSRMIVDDIERFLRGERPVNLVNPEVWDRRG